MMAGLSNSFGLGIILSLADKVSPGAKTASKSLTRLQKQSEETAKRIANQAERIQKSMDGFRTGRNISMGVAAVGAAGVASLGLLTRKAAGFQDTMNNVKSLLVDGTGETEKIAAKQTEDLGKRILNFAGSTRMALDEIGAGAYKLVSALQIEQGGKAIEATVMMAVAGMGTMEQSANLMTSVLDNFGPKWGASMKPVEKAEKIFNQTSSAVQQFNTTLPLLSEGMKYAIPTAASLGSSLSSTYATVGMLQTKGLQGGQAGTSYSAFVRGLLRNSVKDPSKAENMTFDELAKTAMTEGGGKVSGGILSGLKLADAKGQMLEIWQIVENIEKKLGITPEKMAAMAEKYKEEIKKGTMTEEQVIKALGLTIQQVAQLQKELGDEGSRAALMLIGFSQQSKEKQEGIESGEKGVAMYNVRNTGAIAEEQKLSNEAKATAIRLGNTLLDIYENITKKLRSIVKWVREFAEAHPTATKWTMWGTAIVSVLALVGGGIGALIFSIKLLQASMALAALASGGASGLGWALGMAKAAMFSLGNTTTMLSLRIGLLTAAQWALNVAMNANPVGLFLTGVALLIGGIILLYKNWDKLKSSVVSVYGWVRNFARNCPNWLKIYLGPMGLIIHYWEDLHSIVVSVYDNFGLVFAVIESQITRITNSAWWKAFVEGLSIVGSLAKFTFGGVISTASNVVDWLGETDISRATDSMMGDKGIGVIGTAMESIAAQYENMGMSPQPALAGAGGSTMKDYSVQHNTIIIPDATDGKVIAKEVQRTLDDKKNRGVKGRN